MQEAWLAVIEGRKPDSAVRALIRREERFQAISLDCRRLKNAFKVWI
jgi:hypothetical protein